MPPRRLHQLVVTSSFHAGLKELVEYQSTLYETHVIFLDYPVVSNFPSKGGYVSHPIKYTGKAPFLAEMGIIEAFQLVPTLFKMLLEIRRIVKQNRIDFIHAHWSLPAGFLTSIAKKKVPMVLTLRGLDAKLQNRQKLFQPFATFALRRADKVVVLGSDLMKQAKELGCETIKIVKMPVGVDLKRFRPMNKSVIRTQLELADKFTVIYVGNLIKLKRVDLVIESCNKLFSDFDFQLLIIGSGPEEVNLRKQTASCSQPDRIHFVGQVPYTNMPGYIASANVLMLMSESEGLPGCIQEAFACGVPVIATDVGGIGDIVINGENGFLAKDAGAAENDLRTIMGEPGLIAHLSEGALSYALKNLSLDVIVQSLDSLYKSIIKPTSA